MRIIIASCLFFVTPLSASAIEVFACEPEWGSLIEEVAGDVATISQQRSTEPIKLSRALHGDLGGIVMKAVEKERDRRYETANGFAEDIQRVLDNDAVHARPPATA